MNDKCEIAPAAELSYGVGRGSVVRMTRAVPLRADVRTCAVD
ncbi:hypothetical protein OG394_11940 [Kribbella sp. NBC_01245]|nr:hypothetical protein [Kribbella sp. NBC_01245]